mgnify:CR=1 FL=1|jgi:hypothetical protein
MAAFGKINLELWDVSGDFSNEKSWPAIQKDADGVMFVYDPAQPNHEDILTQLVTLFPRAMGLQPKYCMAYVNHHNCNGQIPQHNIPKCMQGLTPHIGTAEDNQGIFQGFEKYLIKLLTLMSEKQRAQEEDML